MIEQIGSLFRKLSLVALCVGLLAAFHTEMFADIPLGRDGRPKPPIARQRLSYLFIIGSGLPGLAWGVVRAIRRDQRTPWE